MTDFQDRERDCVRDSSQVYASAAGLPPSFLRQVVLSATRELDVLTDSEWLLAQLEVPLKAKATRRFPACPAPGLAVVRADVLVRRA